MSLTPSEIIQRALDAGPTPGPWIAPGGYGVYTIMPDGRTGPSLLAATTKSGAMENHDANTAYVAACNPVAIAALLAELKRLQEAVQVQRDFCEQQLKKLEHRPTNRDPKANGYSYAAVPDWLLRQQMETADNALKARL